MLGMGEEPGVDDGLDDAAPAQAAPDESLAALGFEVRDELRTRLAAQQIGMDRYLEMARQSPEELAAELREPASRRVKSLLVLSAIAEKEGVDATPEEIDAEVADQLGRYPGEPRLREYLTSRRGRSYLRMTLRNRTLVDTLIDRATATTE